MPAMVQEKKDVILKTTSNPEVGAELVGECLNARTDGRTGQKHNPSVGQQYGWHKDIE